MRGIPFYVGLMTGIAVEELKKRKIKWSKVIYTTFTTVEYVFKSGHTGFIGLFVFCFLVRSLYLDFRHISGLYLGSMLRRGVLREAQALRRHRTVRIRGPQSLHVDRYSMLDNCLSLDFWLRYVTQISLSS